MKLTLKRLSTSKESTLGALYIDSKFQCWVLEDTKREKKIAGETRIPPGTYSLALRTVGGMTKKYADKYPNTHKGMLWLRDVPDFNFVYIHKGNQRGHTEGCLLVGDSLNNNQIADGFVGHSGQAYARIYPKIAEAILNSEATITIFNEG